MTTEITEKKCSKCGDVKPVGSFYKHKRHRDGMTSQCKTCVKKYRENNKHVAHAYYQKNKEKIRKQSHEWHRKNPEKVRESSRKTHLKYKEKRNQKDREYYQANKEYICARRKQVYEENGGLEYQRRYKEENRERIRKRDRQYFLDNKERIYDRRNERRNKRYYEDVEYRLRTNISNSINIVIDKIKKAEFVKGKQRVFGRLPYNALELKEHLESQFEEWMTWENWGQGEGCWSIDHIHPQSKLPYDSLEHPNFQKCWALDNLRPLCAIENIKKNNKILDNDE